MNVWMNEWMYVWMYECMYEWMNVCMNVWMNEWMADMCEGPIKCHEWFVSSIFIKWGLHQHQKGGGLCYEEEEVIRASS